MFKLTNTFAIRLLRHAIIMFSFFENVKLVQTN